MIDGDLVDRLITGVREFGADDWVQFIDIGHLLIEETGSNENLVERGAQAAVELVQRGIMTPGETTDDGFVPWSVSPQDTIEYIHRQASGISEERQFFWPGDICWFQTDNYEDV